MSGHWCPDWERNLKLWPPYEAMEAALEPMMRDHRYCFRCLAPFDAEERAKKEAILSLVEKARRW